MYPEGTPLACCKQVAVSAPQPGSYILVAIDYSGEIFTPVQIALRLTQLPVQ